MCHEGGHTVLADIYIFYSCEIEAHGIEALGPQVSASPQLPVTLPLLLPFQPSSQQC